MFGESYTPHGSWACCPREQDISSSALVTVGAASFLAAGCCAGHCRWFSSRLGSTHQMPALTVPHAPIPSCGTRTPWTVLSVPQGQTPPGLQAKRHGVGVLGAAGLPQALRGWSRPRDRALPFVYPRSTFFSQMLFNFGSVCHMQGQIQGMLFRDVQSGFLCRQQNQWQRGVCQRAAGSQEY